MSLSRPRWRPAKRSGNWAGCNYSLAFDEARLAILDREGLERRDRGVRIVRIGDHPHPHIHPAAIEIDADIAALAALEKVHVWTLVQRLRKNLVGQRIGRDRSADKFRCHDRRGRI